MRHKALRQGRESLRSIPTVAAIVASVLLVASCGGKKNKKSPTSDDSPPPAPHVVATFPADGAANIPITTVVTVTFDSAMAQETLTDTAVSVDDGSGPALGASSYDDTSHTLTFVPAEALSYGTSYTATLSGSVTDAQGHALGAEVQWSFTTVPDTTPPEVVDTFPADGALDVALDASIYVFFSQPLNPDTVTPTSLTVSGATGSVSYDSTQNAVTFTPDAPFAYGAAVTVTVSTDITNAKGIPLAAPVVWSFTTETDLTRPEVVTWYPTGSAVPWDVLPSIELSEPIDQVTLTADSVGLYRVTTTMFFNTPMTSKTPVPAALTYDNATRTVTLHPDAILDESASYEIDVTPPLADPAGNLVLPGWVPFLTIAEQIPPTVIDHSPALDQVDVPTTETISFTFDDDLDVATVIPANFLVRYCDLWVVQYPSGKRTCQAWASVTVTPTYDANSRTVFIDHTPMVFYKTYQATVTTGLTDKRGNPLAAPFTFSFTTQNDPAGVTVVSTKPEDGARFVSSFGTVRFVFDDRVNPATLTPASLYIDGVAGAVTYNDLLRTATITPSTSLSPGTSYTAHATTDITDMDGNPLDAPVAITFHTNTPKQIRSVSALPQRRNIAVASNDQGTAVAIWTVDYGESAEVWGAIFSSGTWGTQFRVGDAMPEAFHKATKVISNGDSFLLGWRARDGGWKVVYRSGSGSWASPTDFGDIPAPEMATNGIGYVVAFQDGADVWARYVSGNGVWDASTQLATMSKPYYDNMFSLAGGGAGFALSTHESGDLNAYTGDGHTWLMQSLYAPAEGDAVVWHRLVAGNSRFVAAFQVKTSSATTHPYTFRTMPFTTSSKSPSAVVRSMTYEFSNAFPSVRFAVNAQDDVAMVWRESDILSAIWHADTLKIAVVVSHALVPTANLRALASDGRSFAVSYEEWESGSNYRTNVTFYDPAGASAWTSPMVLAGESDTLYGAQNKFLLVKDVPDVGIQANLLYTGIWSGWSYITPAGGVDSYQLIPSPSGFLGVWAQANAVGDGRQSGGLNIWSTDTLADNLVLTTSKDVRIARTGDEAVAVWEQYVGGNWAVYASHLQNSTWSAPVEIAKGDWFQVCHDVASNGVGFVAVLQSSTSVTVRYMPLGGNWSAPTTLATQDVMFGSVGCAVASNGSGYVLSFVDGDRGDMTVVKYAKSANGINWSGPFEWTGAGYGKSRANMRMVSDGTDYFLTWSFGYPASGIAGSRWNGVAWDAQQGLGYSGSYSLVAGARGALMLRSEDGRRHDGNAWLTLAPGPYDMSQARAAWDGSNFAAIGGSVKSYYTWLDADVWQPTVVVSSTRGAGLGALAGEQAMLRWTQNGSEYNIEGAAIIAHKPLTAQLLEVPQGGAGELHLVGGVGETSYIGAATVPDSSSGARILRLWSGL